MAFYGMIEAMAVNSSDEEASNETSDYGTKRCSPRRELDPKLDRKGVHRAEQPAGQKARTLVIKFVTLYELRGELLSKQFHYDRSL
ncbi:hypothetical protein L914_12110 [Phytophthora nicotianae]|uniref:Uncharacterized protein n=1 Tax=Phytophthora nicotianae TaxID=4792 RepID=W2N383_PHYNI|nr:hypothetical protein L914_12110 [Phytophthora nicotianae]